VRAPLRERREDIPKLCDHFLALIGKENGLPPKRLSPAALKTSSPAGGPGSPQLRKPWRPRPRSAGGRHRTGRIFPRGGQGSSPPRPPKPIPLPASRTLGEMERDSTAPPSPRPEGTRPRGEAPRHRPAPPPARSRSMIDRREEVSCVSCQYASCPCRNGTSVSWRVIRPDPCHKFSLIISYFTTCRTLSAEWPR